MSEMDDVVNEFLIESRDNLDQLDRDLVGLEKDPSAADLLANIFRTIHTVKGSSGFLAFGKLEVLTDAGETLLSCMRDGKLLLNAEITSALLTMVDNIRAILSQIELTGREGYEDYHELIARLTRLQEENAQQAGPPAPTKTEAVCTQEAFPETFPEEHLKPIGQLLVENAGVDPSAIEAARQLQRQGDVRRIGEILVDNGACSPAAAHEVIELQNEARAARSADSSIRVDVALLDRLMNLLGELVLARNQIIQFSNRIQDPAFLSAAQRLNLITTELQGAAMKTRMQPIGNLWSRLPRVVRDLALACGKQVRMEMEGKETELDKILIEAIRDPLTHIVRNSLDHGIEVPQARTAAGKNPEGLVFLRAFHQGGQVNIEITDDGAGLDFARIRNKAVQKCLITADQAARMNQREIANFIWRAGFSTAERVTNVSGRGVGMDVVKTNIEKIGGTVEVQSRPGHGTTVRMKIPMTLATVLSS